MDNQHIVEGIHRNKARFRNDSLLFSLLCGHYIGWLYIIENSSPGMRCAKCKKEYVQQNLFSQEECCGLVIPGSCPITHGCTRPEHVELLKFVDRLREHPMFINTRTGRKWKFDISNDYEIVVDNRYKKKVSINPTDAVVLRAQDFKDSRKMIIC